MTLLPWPELLGVALTVLLAYSVFGLTGFGANVVALPLLAHVLPLKFAVPMLLVLDLFTASALGLKNRKRIQWHEMQRLLPWLLLGMLIGVTLLSKAPESVLLGCLGTFVLAYAGWSLLSKGPPRPTSTRWALPAGLVGGTFTALFGTGGPVYTLYLARRLADVADLRATLGGIVFGSALVRLVLFTAGGFYSQAGLLTLAAVLVPCAFAGYLIGSRMHTRLSPQRLVQAVWLLLVVSGSSLLLRSWRGG